MKARFGESKVQPELIKGDNGVFDVVVDGKKIFSKDELDRFPEYQEVPNLILMEGLAD